MWPLMEIVAPEIFPLLSGAVRPSPLSSVTGELLPPVKLGGVWPLGVTLGAPCTTFSVLVSVPLAVPSLTLQSMARLVSEFPLVGSWLDGEKLYVIDWS